MIIESPFVLYRLPQKNKYNLILDKEVYSVSDLSKITNKSFVFAPFETKPGLPIWVFDLSKQTTLNKNELADIQLDNMDYYSDKPIITSKKQHQKKVDQIVKKIQQKEIGKAVLSRVKEVERRAKSLIDIYLQLCDNNPNAFVYLLQLSNGEMWCGASPELLADFNSRNLETMALAGTQLLQNKKLEDIQWETKDIDEQIWVQQHIEKIFNTEKLTFEKGETMTSLAGHLAHIKTDYSINTSPFSAQKVLKQLHPTPAICGQPTHKAKEIIKKTESHQRRYYSGFLGTYNSDRFQLFVNLRCMQIQKDFYYLYIGGGITADSIAELEWQETENKSQTLLKLL